MKELDYYYEMSHKTEDKVLIITPHGVSIEYSDGSILHTNIVPMALFPDCRKLTKAQRMKVAKNAVEGKLYSAKQIKRLYKLWKKFGEP